MVWSGVITTSAVVVAWFHYHNLDNLYRLTRIRGSANVLRDGSWRRLNQKNLVPGDVVKVETGLIYCDMILAGGGTCLVDESALTGESYPHAKVPIDPVDASNKIDKRTHKRHILTAGTTVLETNDSIGVVYRTGSSTTKGELLRQIVGYRRHQFKFDTEVVMVIGILALYAVFQFNMTVYLIEDTTVYGWFYGM